MATPLHGQALTDAWTLIIYATHAQKHADGVADPTSPFTTMQAAAAAQRLAETLKAHEEVVA